MGFMVGFRLDTWDGGQATYDLTVGKKQKGTLEEVMQSIVQPESGECGLCCMLYQMPTNAWKL